MRRRWLVALLFLIGGLAAAGLLLRRHVGHPAADAPMQPTRLFEQVFTHVSRFGVDSIPEAELYQLAANGLLGELEDEYATLLPETRANGLTETADVGGLGLLLATRDGRVSVLSVLPGSVADLAGMAAGDQLLEVNEIALEPGRRDQVLAALTGKPGSSAVVRVRRPGVGPLSFEMTRGEPRSYLVPGSVRLEAKMGYVAVRLLGTGATRTVRREIDALLAQQIQGLILDLRGASQGNLEEGAGLADLFLEPGASLVELRGRDPAPRRLGDQKPQDGRLARLPVVLLVDSSTADAAEVTAGALQDNDRALLVGQPTFGRGLSAETFPLADRMIVRISTGRWYTPVGRAIQRDTATSDTLEQRPRVSTAGGRKVYAGGRIVPDSLVQRDSTPASEQALLQALGSQFPSWRVVLQAVARQSVTGRRIAPDLMPGPEARAQLRRALDSAGVSISDDVWAGAGAAVDRRLGDEMVRAALGEDPLLGRRLRRDPWVARAIQLLRNASSPTALVMGPN
jgi:carboxyl-terminal processing protease